MESQVCMKSPTMFGNFMNEKTDYEKPDSMYEKFSYVWKVNVRNV
jgi:hypothetical protein